MTNSDGHFKQINNLQRLVSNSGDMTGGIPSREVRQAYEDVTRGLTDTDKGPPMHRAYQQQKK